MAMMIVVRGGGDIATATICRLHRCGFQVLILETAQPTTIRRAVSFAEAVYEGGKTVEGITAERVSRHNGCNAVWNRGKVPILVDPEGQCLLEIQPMALIDGIMAKGNIGTHKGMSKITIGLGPGFFAGKDVDCVIETVRGHSLGRIIWSGPASPDTGTPAMVEGFTTERVIYAPQPGTLAIIQDIGKRVNKGELLATIDSTPITSPISGCIRGMIRDHFFVSKGLKIIDIDPRTDNQTDYTTISDKARCISGGVLEALLYLLKSRGKNR